jgi:hypothetical protein
MKKIVERKVSVFFISEKKEMGMSITSFDIESSSLLYSAGESRILVLILEF